MGLEMISKVMEGSCVGCFGECFDLIGGCHYSGKAPYCWFIKDPFDDVFNFACLPVFFVLLCNFVNTTTEFTLVLCMTVLLASANCCFDEFRRGWRWECVIKSEVRKVGIQFKYDIAISIMRYAID